MGIIDIARGRDTGDDRTTDAADGSPAGDAGEPDATTETDTTGGGRRRLGVVLVGLAVTLGVIQYLRSRGRAAREAEFTEIEFEPTETADESESASTE